MPKLTIRNNTIKTFFHLLGESENDITYSIGWTLAESKTFLNEFLKTTINWNKEIKYEDFQVMLQKYKKNKGITDVELLYPGLLHIIVEAKKGWNYPKKQQLEKYGKRLQKSAAEIKKILVLSECSNEYISAVFKPNKSTLNLSYKKIYEIANKAYKKANHHEKYILKQLSIYLSSIMTMQKLDSNLVYVVSLNNKKMEGWTITNKEIAIKKKRYEYPVGKNWPNPPNYIAFRYNGELQSIHHVENYDIFTNPRQFFKEAPSIKIEPHYILKLGKPFKPEKTIRNGGIYPNGRYWCMLDTLFTCKTIKEARDVTKKRLEEIPN